ncbi:MAG: hypothetical protein P8Y70_02345 [Candidatus Lokiarchaeota archaeon]
MNHWTWWILAIVLMVLEAFAPGTFFLINKAQEFSAIIKTLETHMQLKGFISEKELDKLLKGEEI